MVKLVISDSEGAVTIVPLVRDEISIGRKEGNTIRLTERNVSRKHAQLRRANGAYKLKDLDSYVGTLVNGSRVELEAEIRPGDTIQIGDYSIAVQAEGQVEEPAPRIEEETTRVAKVRAPHRLVVLADPTPGAVIVLPETGAVKIGRAEDVGIHLDHASVSREHAEIERVGEQFRVRDLGSANGTRIGGERIVEGMLASGDVLALGKVLLRFVPAGENYVFDPTEADAYLPPRPRTGMWVAVAIGAAVLIAAIVAIPPDDEPVPVVSPTSEPAVATAATPEPEPSPLAREPAAAPEPDPYQRNLEDCRSALGAGRFVEAVAHANEALRVRPQASDAERCRVDAQRGAEEEQSFVRGKAALDRGDAEAAYREFSMLAPDSVFHDRPEVAQSVAALGTARLTEARSVLARHPGDAARLAGGLLDVPGMPDAIRADAKQVLAQAQAREVTRTSARSAATSARASAAEPRGGKSPMDAASECLAVGDNACVVRALRGRAKTAQELGLLIETYRAMGQAAEAQQQMSVYVKRFPTGRRAEAYRSMLGRKVN